MTLKFTIPKLRMMDQLLKPEKFSVHPACIGAEAKWKHWKQAFSNFLSEINNITDANKLKQTLSKDCNFKAMTAEQYKCEYIRDSFIRGLRNPRIRERLLENSTITLEKAFYQARALELAESH